MHVLLLDSTAEQARLAQILNRRGHEVVSEGSGSRAIELLDDPETHFDALVMEVVLRDLDGLSVLAHLVESLGESAPPTVVVSDFSQMSVVEQALGLGIRDFVVKPFSDERLEAALSRMGC